jgi:hypothetical protein
LADVGTTSPGSPSATHRLRRLARYSYEAEESDELDMHAGDVIDVLATGQDSGWWFGEIVDSGGGGTRQGSFPVSWTSPVDGTDEEKEQ